MILLLSSFFRQLLVGQYCCTMPLSRGMRPLARTYASGINTRTGGAEHS
ncbi:MAG: hypothetical protein JWO59_3552 [Chloroflexi bacterium]|nr:hypothetical protein [Chloroflexota bacterium]